MYKYLFASENKSVFNWTVCQLLQWKTQLHEKYLRVRPEPTLVEHCLTSLVCSWPNFQILDYVWEACQGQIFRLIWPLRRRINVFRHRLQFLADSWKAGTPFEWQVGQVYSRTTLSWAILLLFKSGKLYSYAHFYSRKFCPVACTIKTLQIRNLRIP